MIVVAIIGVLAAVAIPNVSRARNAARRKTCIENLRMIDFAKGHCALENNVGTGSAISNDLITPYIRGSLSPTAAGTPCERRRTNAPSDAASCWLGPAHPVYHGQSVSREVGPVWRRRSVPPFESGMEPADYAANPELNHKQSCS